VTTSVPLWVGRAAIAVVWLYHGLWNKLLAAAGRHAEIVAQAPSIAGLSSHNLLLLIGTAEVLLAAWVFSGFRPRLAAAAQTVLLLVMNAGGLIWARDQIADPGAMIVQNLALLVLIWMVALAPPSRQEHA
jgi:uncharacterized membrane protein YphA (DoxX/SURF4 family)